jgi:predicted unusual protein kinase regulating ubiquinone biosynthesis (AarF/ABC1/UbiB family)
VPQPVLDYSTRSVLTMEYITGRKVTSLTPLARLDVKGLPLCDELFRAYLKQVLVDGLFHADPHPGNVFLTGEGRIAMLDLGMTGTTTPAMQEHLLKLLLAVSDGRGEEAAAVVIGMSRTTEEYAPEQFRTRMTKIVVQRQDRAQLDTNVGRTLLDISRAAAEHGIRVPSQLTLLGKTLLQLDEIGRILDPRFQPNASVHRNAGELMARRMRRISTKEGVFTSLLEMKDFLTGLPARLNRIMDALGDSELEVKVRALDAEMVVEGLQKVANRIATGLVLAALIIGAALLMRVDTAFRILGYPGLAMLCFLAAAAGGFYLVVSIFVQDQKSARKTAR